MKSLFMNVFIPLYLERSERESVQKKLGKFAALKNDFQDYYYVIYKNFLSKIGILVYNKKDIDRVAGVLNIHPVNIMDNFANRIN